MEALTVYQILCYFMIYSVLGWAVEVAYQAISKGIIVNRGFLNGPLCPIYGCGVVSILLLLRAVGRNHPEAFHALGIFVIGVILSTTIELFGGWILDKAFHARWWDYRDQKFNLNGYICPQFAIIWGFGILIVVRIVHPFIRGIVVLIPQTTVTWLILSVIYLIFTTDIVTSVSIMIGLNRRFAELDEIQSKLSSVSDRVSTKIGENTLEGVGKVEHARLEVALARAELRDEIDEKQDALADRLREMESKYENRKKEIFTRVKSHRLFGAGRLLFGNPTFQHRDYIRYIEELRDLDL